MTDTPDQDYPIDNSEVPLVDEMEDEAAALEDDEPTPFDQVQNRKRSMLERDIEVYIKPGPTPAYPNVDGKTVLEGIIRAWRDDGANLRHPDKTKRRLRTEMPVLTRWLDKVSEQGHIEVHFRDRLREFYPHYEEQLMLAEVNKREIKRLNDDLNFINNELAAAQKLSKARVTRLAEVDMKLREANEALTTANEGRAAAQDKASDFKTQLERTESERNDAHDHAQRLDAERETLQQRLEQDGAQLQAVQAEHQEMGQLLRAMTARYEEAQHNYLSEQTRATNLLEQSNEWQTESQRKGRQVNSWKQKYDVMISDPRRMVQMGLEMLQRTHAANQASMVNGHFESIKKHAEEMLALTDVSGMDRVLPEEGDTPGDEPSWREPEDTRDPLHTNPLATARTIARQRAAEIMRENASNPEEQYRRGEANDFNG